MKICSRCIMDTRVPDITFDEKGECNYCKKHDEMCKQYPDGEEGQKKLEEIAEKIKKAGKGNRYDCLVGISGGCDSSFLLHTAKKLGLRPLAAHFDDNWNTELAEENMRRITKAMNVDFIKIGVDKKEFDDMQRAHLLAGVPEPENPNDVAVSTLFYLIADKFNIKYAFEGHSFRTEGFTPLDWTYFDAKYVQSVQKKYGALELKTFPNFWLRKWLYWSIVKGIKRIRPLEYVTYKKEDVKKLLNKEYGWKWYGGHHLENKFTAFSASYIQPKKFGIDLRLVEFSALIRSGQMTIDEALRKIKEPPKISNDIIKEVKNRLGFTDKEFEKIMKGPKRSYRNFETYKPLFRRWRWFFWLAYKMDWVPKTFYIKYTRKDDK